MLMVHGGGVVYRKSNQKSTGDYWTKKPGSGGQGQGGGR